MWLICHGLNLRGKRMERIGLYVDWSNNIWLHAAPCFIKCSCGCMYQHCVMTTEAELIPCPSPSKGGQVISKTLGGQCQSLCSLWRRPGGRFCRDCILPILVSGHVSMSVWICVSHDCQLELRDIHRNMTGVRYQDMKYWHRKWNHPSMGTPWLIVPYSCMTGCWRILPEALGNSSTELS